MLKLKNKKIFIFFITVFLIFSISSFVLAENDSNNILKSKIDISVKNANMNEVLNVISNTTNLNITHNVSGNTNNTMSLDFENVALEEVLNYVTTMNNLDYIVKNNIVYIGSQEQLSKLYESRIVSKVYQYSEVKKEKIIKLLKNGDIINVDNIKILTIEDGLFLFKGEEKVINKANDFLQKYLDFKTAQNKPQYNIETIEVRFTENLKELKTDLLKMFSEEVEIRIENNSFIVMYNNDFPIEQFKKKVQEMDDFFAKENRKIEIININYTQLEQMQSYITSYFPDLMFNINKESRDLIVRGSKAEIEKVKEYVRKIDKPKPQVLLEIRIEEISRRDLKNVGVNPEMLSKIQLIRQDYSQTNMSGDSTEKELAENDKLNIAEIGGIGLTIPEFINLKESASDSKTLANPSLMALDGVEAHMVIGDQIPYQTQKMEKEVAITNTEYRDVGIELTFTPKIHSDQTVQLQLNPAINNIGGQMNGQPIIQTRSINTTVRLKDQETFAIGGLIQEKDIENLSGIPILKDLPFFGKLFENRDTEKVNSEIIIFITPTIIK